MKVGVIEEMVSLINLTCVAPSGGNTERGEMSCLTAVIGVAVFCHSYSDYREGALAA